jgi:hypothetical protein
MVMKLMAKRKQTEQMLVNKFKIFIAVLMVFFISTNGLAQGGFGNGLPITVKLNTPVNVPFGNVEFVGNVQGLEDAPPLVFIEIKKPDGAIDQISGRADKSTGNFLIKYFCTTIGNYEATAYAGDKIQNAKIEFEVTADVEVDKSFTELNKEATKAVSAIDAYVIKGIQNMVKPEEVNTAKQKIEKLKKAVTDFNKHFTAITKATADLNALCKKYPDVKKVAAPYLAKLASEVKNQTDIVKQVTKDLKTSETPVDDCKKAYMVAEAAAAYSTTMNFAAGGILKIGASIFIDKVWPIIAEKKIVGQFSDNDKFLFTQTGKGALTALDGIKEIQTSGFAAGMAGDLAQYISKSLFKQYCTEYKGVVSGTYGVESKNEGKMYLKYQLTFEGSASLYCKNTELKKGIPKLNGYLEANVSKIDFTDNVWAVEDKKEWDEVKYVRIPFPVVPMNASQSDSSLGFGALARAALPGAFYLPLEAKIVQEKMIIKIMPAKVDFSELFTNKTLVVARAKYGAKNLSGGVFEYPIEKGFFIISRAVKQGDDAPMFTLDITKANQTKVLKGEFPRTVSPSGDIKVDFLFKIELKENEGTKK